MPKLSNLQARRGASTIRIVAVAIVTIAAAYGSLWIVTKSFLDQSVGLSNSKTEVLATSKAPQVNSKTEGLESSKARQADAQLFSETDEREANDSKSDRPPNASLGRRSDGKMNILFLLADDLRSESMVYGKPTFTPNLARLAARGVVFDRAYAQVTVCNPSRNSFMTGRVPDVTQVWNFERVVGSETVTLPIYFRGQGYRVLGTGKVWHWGPGPGENWSDDVAPFWPDNIQFQELIKNEKLSKKSTVAPHDEPPSPDFIDVQFASRALELLSLLASGEREPKANKPKNVAQMLTPHSPYPKVKSGASVLDDRPPFFLAVGFHLPHEPHVFPTSIWDAYSDVDLPPLRGRIAKKPFGMPNYALGDVLTSFTYLNATMDGLTESVGTNYGTALLRKPWLSPIANFELNEAFPDLMHHELLRGYCSGVTFMDEQLGKVVDGLRFFGFEESTIIVFFSDHGYAVGERGQWGKRSLFESDARVPLIVADPRYPNKHGSRTSSFAELVDLFPTLVELAGVKTAVALVPPLSGKSVARWITGGDAIVRKWALTQFSRCPIVASEFLVDISGKGPKLVEESSYLFSDYRARPGLGAAYWECAWKGWEWDDFNDLVLMGYSLRVDGWRYTAWLPWDTNLTIPLWVYPPFGEELYEHDRDPVEPPNTFNELETVNLLEVDGLSDPVEPVQSNHKLIAKKLFNLLRKIVIKRRSSMHDEFYVCDRIEMRSARETCKKQASNAKGYDISMMAQFASDVDSRKLQRSPHLKALLDAPIVTLPLPLRGSGDSLPARFSDKLRRLRLRPDIALDEVNKAVAGYETVARVGDVVVVGDVEMRFAQLEAHRNNAVTAVGTGVWYRVSKRFIPELVPKPLNITHPPRDLLLELIGSSMAQPRHVVSPGDSQAMGVGYISRVARPDFARVANTIKGLKKLALPVEDINAPVGSVWNTSESYTESIPPSSIPKKVYVSSRALALSPDASWSERVTHVQWLPLDLAEFDRRLAVLR